MLFLPFLSSCENGDNRTDALLKKVSALEAEVSKTEKRLSQLTENLKWTDAINSSEGTVILIVGSTGYGLVKSDLGKLTVSLINIVPFANGSKVTLQIGNLTSVTINGLKATMQWGSVDDKGSIKVDATKSRDISTNASLLSGASNQIEIVLEGVPPSAIGFLSLERVIHRGISFRSTK